MKRLLRICLLILMSTVTFACSSTTKSVRMTDHVTFGAERHQTWNRPYEVGFEMGDKDIEASASEVTLFPIFGWISDLLGVDDNLTSIAIYDAVKRERVDGMYITATKRVNTGFWPIFSHVKVYVYGKALTLKKIGQVSKERADEIRKKSYTKQQRYFF